MEGLLEHLAKNVGHGSKFPLPLVVMAYWEVGLGFTTTLTTLKIDHRLYHLFDRLHNGMPPFVPRRLLRDTIPDR